MKKFVLLSAFLFASVAFSYAQFQFTSIDYPGAFGTRVHGINNHGQIVGSYVDQDGYFHAMLIDHGKFIPLAPDSVLAIYSEAVRINDRGDIVGFYCDDVACHGFLLRKNVVTTIDFPGASDTQAWGINESGAVVGFWDIYDSQGNLVSLSGFTWKNGNIYDLTYPGAADTSVTAINARGHFVGVWDASLITKTSGFLFSSGQFTSFDAPLPDVFLTQPDGINAHGDIIGQAYTASGLENGIGHGFLITKTFAVLIDVPGATLTTGWDINASDMMIGNWIDTSNVIHGWVAQSGGKGNSSSLVSPHSTSLRSTPPPAPRIRVPKGIQTMSR